jgi:hypothetical protein
MQYQTYVLSPDDLVAVYFTRDDPAGVAKASQYVFMPAVSFLALYNKRLRQEVELAVQVGFVVGGISGVAAAPSWLGRIVGLIEIALNAAA